MSGHGGGGHGSIIGGGFATRPRSDMQMQNGLFDHRAEGAVAVGAAHAPGVTKLHRGPPTDRAYRRGIYKCHDAYYKVFTGWLHDSRPGRKMSVRVVI